MAIRELDNREAMRQAVEAAARDLRAAPWCLAACVGGSYATGQADAWADLDFRTIVAAEQYEAVLARRYEIPRAWGDAIYDEGVPGNCWAIVHCRPFFKIDVWYYRQGNVPQSPHWLLPQMILYDPHGLLAETIREAASLPHDASQWPLAYLKSKAVATAEEVRRKLLRGQRVYVHAFLTELRDWIVRIHQCVSGSDRRQYPLKYLECAAPGSFREAMLASDHGMSAAGMDRSLRDLSALLLDLLDEDDEPLKLALRTATDW